MGESDYVESYDEATYESSDSSSSEGIAGKAVSSADANECGGMVDGYSGVASSSDGSEAGEAYLSDGSSCAGSRAGNTEITGSGYYSESVEGMNSSS